MVSIKLDILNIVSCTQTQNLSSLGLCTSQDVDIFIRHMNNARYLRELDFARFHYYACTGLYERIKEQGGGAVQGASSIRYRRSIPILNPYKVTTRVRRWLSTSLTDTINHFVLFFMCSSSLLVLRVVVGLVGRQSNLFGAKIYNVWQVCESNRDVKAMHHQCQCVWCHEIVSRWRKTTNNARRIEIVVRFNRDIESEIKERQIGCGGKLFKNKTSTLFSLCSHCVFLYRWLMWHKLRT